MSDPGAIRLQLLGPLTIARGDVTVALPHSRKVIALIAYLALSSRPVARSHLCELLWDVPNDPRGELRWCLSKARALLDAPGHARVQTWGDTLGLDLADASVDAIDVDGAVQAGLATLTSQRLRELLNIFRGDFLQGVEIARSAAFGAWLVAQRRRYRASHAAILEQLLRTLPAACDDAITMLGQWLQMAPFDRHAHALLLDALARRGLLSDGDEHVAAAAKLFDAEGQDFTALGRAWRDAKLRHAGSPLSVPAPAPTSAAALVIAMAPADASTAPTRRASIAVMPFTDRSRSVAARGGLADALAHDIITRLAKLRSLFVIAPGTVFALDERSIGAEEAGRTLGIDYVTSGWLRRDGTRLLVDVQLCETRSARIVWADDFAARPHDTLGVLDEICDRIVASICEQVEASERNRALLKPPDSLDAWEAHHRGLWHMFRYTPEDNEHARRFFEQAVRLDPTFSRPYAGLSFTHFQRAFMSWADRPVEIEGAYRTAAQALAADDRDPAAHWSMGRAFWLRRRIDESLAEIQQSVELSPNFALGHYMLAFVQAQSGNAEAAVKASDWSRRLSPFDPMLFGMLGSRAMALTRLGRHDEAVEWALKAIARPNAPVHVTAIGVYCLALVGRVDEARSVSEMLLRRAPSYNLKTFLEAYRFDDNATEQWRRAAKRLGAE